MRVVQMKMGKNSLGFEVFLTTMKEAANPLYMMFMYVCLAVVTYGCIMYYIEKGEYDFPDSEGGTGGEFGVYVVSFFLSLVCPQLTLLLHYFLQLQDAKRGQEPSVRLSAGFVLVVHHLADDGGVRRRRTADHQREGTFLPLCSSAASLPLCLAAWLPRCLAASLFALS